jgi:uncharacterized membrane protein
MQKRFLSVKSEILAVSVLIFVLNVVLKFLYISSNDIALDEPFTLFYSQMDLGSIFKMLQTENNPALHFLFMHFWIKLFGVGAMAVRMPSLIFSALTAVVIYITGRKFFSGSVGLTASAIFTFAGMHIYFSHEARVYSLFVLLASLSFLYFLKLTSNPDKKSLYFTLFLFNLLLIYSHYFGFFVVFTEFVCLFFIRNLKKAYKGFFLVFAALAISYLPNIIIFFNRFFVSVSKGTWVKAPQITEYYGNLNRFLNIKYVTMTFLVIMLVTLIFLLKKKLFIPKLKEFIKNENYILTLLWFFVPYTLMFLISFKVPMFLDRYLLFCSIPFYFLLAQIIFHFVLKEKAQITAAVLFVMCVILTTTLNPSNKRNVKELSALIKDIKKPGDIIYIAPDYSKLEFIYHYNIDYFKDYKNLDENLKKDNFFPIKDISELKTEPLNSGNLIILLDCGYKFAFGNNAIYDKLNSNYSKIAKYHVDEIYEVSCFAQDRMKLPVENK